MDKKIKKSKFKVGDTVMIKCGGICSKGSVPKEYFSLDTKYFVKDIGLYTNSRSDATHWSVLVYGSSQYVSEDLFDPWKVVDHERIKLEFAISQLEQHIVHPMKPGYRRHDILDKIKELKSQLEAL